MTTRKSLVLAVALIFATLTPINGVSKTITIAVIDTGIDGDSIHKLCKQGHKSFVDNNPLKDEVGHGTHIAGLISKWAGKGDYCIVSIKWYRKDLKGSASIDNMRRAIQYANNINATFINLSGGGTSPNSLEKEVIERAIDKGITIVAAAGNNSSSLDYNCDFYPACYDSRIVVVGNLNKNLKTEFSSNYGKYVKKWEVGTDVVSNLPNRRLGSMTGTSQATAVATGKMVHRKLVPLRLSQRQVK